ncbi:MAG: nucleotidyltransferase domain-containing protein [Candidatus Cloacimonetes bacterium]|nr:nucleotidyltransferase domain-containing protein [Candidatus Cloacimonadota bacterium]
MISEKEINKIIETLVATAKPQKIYLFGSYARGDAQEKSDLDFLVVEHKLSSQRKEMVRLHDAVRSMRLPVDILVTGESHFKEWSKIPGSVIHRAITEGKLYYEKH